MAKIVLTADANWSHCNGGTTVPTSEDDIYLNGHNLTLDTGLGGGGNEFHCWNVRARTGDGYGYGDYTGSLVEDEESAPSLTIGGLSLRRA